VKTYFKIENKKMSIKAILKLPLKDIALFVYKLPLAQGEKEWRKKLYTSTISADCPATSSR
jgi:hypothetical protein